MPCRRILSPSEDSNLLEKKILFPLVKSLCPAHSLPTSSCSGSWTWLEGWEEAQENEEVKKYPMAVRLEEFYPSAPVFCLGLLASQKL